MCFDRERCAWTALNRGRAAAATGKHLGLYLSGWRRRLPTSRAGVNGEWGYTATPPNRSTKYGDDIAMSTSEPCVAGFGRNLPRRLVLRTAQRLARIVEGLNARFYNRNARSVESGFQTFRLAYATTESRALQAFLARLSGRQKEASPG